MVDIRLITAEDIPNLKYTKLEWDVEVNGVPYQVINVPGFAHCLGGHLDYGDGNCYWAYPLGEDLTIDNLVEFDGEPGAAWGIEYTPTNSIRTKWGETEIRNGRKLVITRNGKPFYSELLTLHKALAYIQDGLIHEHPLDLNFRGYDSKAIGRKVWYRSEPGVIERCNRSCVTIVPDGMEEFSIPKEYQKEDGPYDEPRTCIVTSIFDPHIWWFRD